MNGETRWWGFRLRFPLDYRPKPLSPVERITFGLLVGTALNLLWLVYLVLTFDRATDVEELAKDDLLVPILLAAVPLALCVLLPGTILRSIRVGPWIMLSRERGHLRKWDMWMALLAVAGGVLLVFRIKEQHSLVMLIVLALVFTSSVGLAFFQERVDLMSRRWRFRIPDWLRGEEETEEDEDEVVGPDEDADVVFTLHADEGVERKIGIQIPGDVLAKLRRINSEHRGFLYQNEPQAVVLMDRDPVKGVGREEVQRFCRQIASVARERALTRYRLANVVLELVQREIAYRFDEDSTGEFEGGPYNEYGRFALETLQDQVGDCDCTALLAATLLAHLGLETALIYVRVPDERTGEMIGHLAVGLDADGSLLPDGVSLEGFDVVEGDEGRPYLYGETAIDGGTMGFGGVPGEWRERMEVRVVVGIESPQ